MGGNPAGTLTVSVNFDHGSSRWRLSIHQNIPISHETRWSLDSRQSKWPKNNGYRSVLHCDCDNNCNVYRGSWFSLLYQRFSRKFLLKWILKGRRSVKLDINKDRCFIIFKAATYTLCALMPVVVGLVKICGFIFYRPKILEIIRYTQNDFWNSEYGDFGNTVLRETNRKGMFFICSFVFFVGCTVTCYITTPLIGKYNSPWQVL